MSDSRSTITGKNKQSTLQVQHNNPSTSFSSSHPPSTIPTIDSSSTLDINNIMNWTVDELIEWFQSIDVDLSTGLQKLRKKQIDGATSLQYTVSDWHELGIKESDAKNIVTKINRVKPHDTATNRKSTINNLLAVYFITNMLMFSLTHPRLVM
jgi:hypothetical protein